MVTLADLYDQVIEVAPGCPQTTAENRIFEVFRYFCSQTEANQQDISQPITTGDTDYTVTSPTDYDLLNVISVLNENGDEYTDWSWDKNKQQFSLDTEPSGDKTYTLTCSLVPQKGNDQTAVVIPDNINTRWQEGLIFGAQSKLLLMVHQPWSNPALSAAYYQIFSEDIDNARINAITRRGKRAPRTKDWF